MPDYSLFNLDFDPVLKQGWTARLHQAPDNFVDVYVQAVGPLAAHRHDFGALTGVVTAGECTHLEMPSGEMAQYRYLIRGNFEVHLQHPVGVDQYRTKNAAKGTRSAAFRMRPWSLDPDGDPLWQTYWRQSEFLVLEDYTPRFDIYPFQPVEGGTDGYVDFVGYRYSLKPLPAGERPQVTLWVNNWPAGMRLTHAAS